MWRARHGIPACVRAGAADPCRMRCAQVQDISAEPGAEPSFELVEAVHYWEVPLASAGPMENPVRTWVCTPPPLVNG